MVLADVLPSVFDYLDYRKFLRDHYQAAKASNAKFSFRYFSRRAGISSSNFLKLVMDGKRNLGPTTVEGFATALKLDAGATAFFRDLVSFAQADTVAERNRAFERISAHRRFRFARKLDGPLFRYLTRWYYPAVRELAGRSDFVEDPSWIMNQLRPSITLREARAALETLRELGLLVEGEDGRLVRGEPSLTTGHEVRDTVIPAYHRQMIERAASAVDDVPPAERDISAVTVCIRASTLADLKERIHRFEEDVLERCDSDSEPEIVYQLCVQLFPLSRAPTVP